MKLLTSFLLALAAVPKRRRSMSSVAAFSDQSRSDFFGSRRLRERRIFRSRRAALGQDRLRLADSGEQREAIFRLRYQAYMREGAISPNSSKEFSDPYDETGNVYLFGLYIDDELASSIRIHVASKEHPDFPSLEVFPDILQPELDAGKVIVDPTRFVADENLVSAPSRIAVCHTPAFHGGGRIFRADHLLAAVRAEHQAFYRRLSTSS